MSEVRQDSTGNTADDRTDQERIVAFANKLVDEYCIVKDRYLNRELMIEDIVELIRSWAVRLSQEDRDFNGDDLVGSELPSDLQDILFCDNPWVDIDTRTADADIEITREVLEFYSELLNKSFEQE